MQKVNHAVPSLLLAATRSPELVVTFAVAAVPVALPLAVDEDDPGPRKIPLGTLVVELSTLVIVAELDPEAVPDTEAEALVDVETTGETTFSFATPHFFNLSQPSPNASLHHDPLEVR